MNEIFTKKARKVPIIDLAHLGSFADAQPIIKELSSTVEYFRLGLSALMGSFNLIQLTAETLPVKFFYDLDINTDLEQMRLLGKRLKHSGAAMVSIHCSAGLKSIERLVEQIKIDSRPFREDWEKAPEEENLRLPMRPMLFAVTIPSYFEPCYASTSFGDYNDRMRTFNALIEKPVFDGVICSAKKISDYRHNSYDHVKKMVFDAPDNFGYRFTISPTRAIECGADYLVIREPIINPPPGSSRVEEAAKILAETSVALEKKSRIKAAGLEVPRRRAAPTTTATHALSEITKSPPVVDKKPGKKTKKIKFFHFNQTDKSDGRLLVH